MSHTIREFFAQSTSNSDPDWTTVVAEQYCPYLDRTCVKTRKSEPQIAIGTCVVTHGVRNPQAMVICPHRFLRRGQIFVDCLHLLTLHEPGNELHRIAEVEVPGGNVDYFLASVHAGKVIDFVGIELQALDTTGTVWPARQQFLGEVGVLTEPANPVTKPYGMNWKMTAKTTLMQLHHKVETFEALNKHLVLVMQDHLLEYMQREFNFAHMTSAKLGHSLQFHAYHLLPNAQQVGRLQLATRLSTDATGMAQALGLQANPHVELDTLLATLSSKLSDTTMLTL